MIRRLERMAGHAAALMVLTAASAVAQAGQSNSTEDRLLDCDSLERQEDRMACINELVEQLREKPAEDRNADAAIADAEASSTAGAEIVTPAVESQSAADSVSKGSAGTVGAVSAAEQLESVRSPENVAEPATTAEAEADNGIVISDPRPQRMEDVRKEFEPFSATIVRVREHLDGRFSVELDNGQVWRETQKTRIRTPRVGRKVEVKAGRIGGHQMVVEGIPTAAWVRRTK